MDAWTTTTQVARHAMSWMETHTFFASFGNRMPSGERTYEKKSISVKVMSENVHTERRVGEAVKNIAVNIFASVRKDRLVGEVLVPFPVSVEPQLLNEMR